MPKEESTEKTFKLQCSACFKYFNASQEAWLHGGIVTCPHCKSRRRFEAHAKPVKIPPMTEIKLWGRKKK